MSRVLASGLPRPCGRYSKRVTGDSFLYSISKYFLHIWHVQGLSWAPPRG